MHKIKGSKENIKYLKIIFKRQNFQIESKLQFENFILSIKKPEKEKYESGLKWSTWVLGQDTATTFLLYLISWIPKIKR